MAVFWHDQTWKLSFLIHLFDCCFVLEDGCFVTEANSQHHWSFISLNGQVFYENLDALLYNMTFT